MSARTRVLIVPQRFSLSPSSSPQNDEAPPAWLKSTARFYKCVSVYRVQPSLDAPANAKTHYTAGKVEDRRQNIKHKCRDPERAAGDKCGNEAHKGNEETEGADESAVAGSGGPAAERAFFDVAVDDLADVHDVAELIPEPY